MVRIVRSGVVWLTIMVALLVVPSASLTADDDLGAIEGMVTDADGAPIAGVTVTVSGLALSGKRFAATDGDGRFRIDSLPAAAGYQVDFALEDWQSVIQMNLSVSAGEVVPLTIQMKAVEYSENVTDPRKPMIDSTSSTISEEFTPEFLDDIPNGRTYLDPVSMVAGVAGLEEPYRRDDSMAFHVHGGDRTDNVYMLDGLETTDVATGRSGMQVPWEAIESVEVLTGGLTAEYGRATGGLVNVVTRTGGNSFHGSVPIYYTDLGLKRDTDEDHAYFEEEEFDELEWGASVGGPVLRDHLWFFATYNSFTRTIEGIDAEDEVIERDDTFRDGLFNLTWQINDDNLLKAEYADSSSVWESRDTLNPSILPSAIAQTESGNTLWRLKWTSIFTPDLFLEAQLGQHEATHTMGPANAGFFDPRFVDGQHGEGTIIYGNVSAIEDVHRPRMQYQAALNWYRSDWAGEHNFKFGAEYQDLEYETDRIYPDAYTINRSYSDYNVLDQWIDTTDVNYLDTGKILTLYAQDSWTWHENWTFNLGLRWEQQEQKNDVGELVYEFDNLLSPRLGATWDISGDGRSRLFTHYGRYHHAVGMMLAATLNRQSKESWGYQGDYETDDWEEIAHTGLFENPTTVDENLKPNVKDEYILGYEFEFLADFVAGARLIYNQQNNMIEDVLANEDAIRRGENTTGNYTYHITNVESARRQYRGLELSCKKRLSNNYQFLAVCTLSQAKGSVTYDNWPEGLSLYADFEELKYNRYGSLPWDDKQYLKVNGSYHLPLGFIVGASLNWRSGRPYSRIDPNMPPEAWNFGYTRQYYLDPRGSERVGSAWWIDLRLRKDFTIGPTTLSLTADAFNLTNNQDVTSRHEIDTYYYGEPTGWMGAGYFVLGGKLTF